MNKQELIALVKELLQEENLENRNEDLQLLRREYKYLLGRDEDSFAEQEETDKFIALFNELAKKEPKLLSSPYEEKKKIIEAARKLLDKKEILAANKDLDKLSDDFRKAGRSGSKEQDDELWNEFRQVKDAFYAKKKAFFEELDKANAEKRAKKEDIIERAKAVIEVENIREANAQMDALRKEWKEVGYSGKGDEFLWKDFARVMDEFQEKKKERHGEMLKLFEERAARLRVLQDCSQTYGAKIIINRIECDDFEAGKASDTFDFEILPQNLRLNSKGMKPKCCHTYNQIVSLEVVDFLAERFVWFQPFLILRRKIRSAYYKVLRLF